VTAYVADAGSDTVTPILAATNTAGHPITVGDSPFLIAATPDGKIVYTVNTYASTVTRIQTATNTAGTPIVAGHVPYAIAIAP
jgi:YVTN family beta-propeller protein